MLEQWLVPILALVFMEGLLSADNALVLAIMSRRLKDPIEQKRALFYGLWGAIVFRAIFICLGTLLVKFWLVKVFGALYLAKIAYDHFSGKDKEDDDKDGMLDQYQNTWMHKILRKFGINLSLFWSVIVSIEMMDIAFSADSILAAFAISDSFYILLLGGVFGILMMRGVAGVFIKLIAKVPEMEQTAFILIGIIAAKMGLSTIHNFAALFGKEMHEIHISNLIFFSVLVATFLATFVVHYFRKNKHNTPNFKA